MPSSTGTLVFNDQKIQAPDIYATESLGVGVSDPTSNLQVNGNMRIDNGSIKLYRPDTTGGPSLTFYNPDDSVSGWFGFGSSNRNEFRMATNNNYPLTFYTSATGSGVERMRIASDGNVGIGTNNPGAKLDINGYTKNYNSCWSLWHFNTSANSTGTLKFQYHKCTPINCTVNQSGGYYYRVTITVPGRYYIGFSAFSEGNLANATSIELSIRKNGSSQVRSYVNIPATNYYAALSPVTCILDLVVNDYIEIYSTNYLHYNSNGSFYGFLLG